jgi:hypothetical protein
MAFSHSDYDEKEQDILAEDSMDPRLGLATTETLFRELIARFAILLDGRDISLQTKVDNALILAEMLGSLTIPEREYRTVDSY